MALECFQGWAFCCGKLLESGLPYCAQRRGSKTSHLPPLLTECWRNWYTLNEWTFSLIMDSKTLGLEFLNVFNNRRSLNRLWIPEALCPPRRLAAWPACLMAPRRRQATGGEPANVGGRDSFGQLLDSREEGAWCEMFGGGPAGHWLAQAKCRNWVFLCKMSQCFFPGQFWDLWRKNYN